jgi:hypothetical protein
VEILTALLLIACGMVAAAGWIVSRSPKARHAIDVLIPFQGLLGVALLAVGLIDLISWMDVLHYAFARSALFGFTVFGSIASAIVLGFLLGMPQIARWMAGDTPAEKKAMEVQQALGAYSTLVGLVGVTCGALLLLYRLRIL